MLKESGVLFLNFRETGWRLMGSGRLIERIWYFTWLGIPDGSWDQFGQLRSL